MAGVWIAGFDSISAVCFALVESNCDDLLFLNEKYKAFVVYGVLE